MFNNLLIILLACHSVILSLLGSWSLVQTDYYSVDSLGKEQFESSERSNVLPQVSFFFYKEGLITWGNGKKTSFLWEYIDDDIIKIKFDNDSVSSHLYRLSICDNCVMLEEQVSESFRKKQILAINNYSLEESEETLDCEITERDVSNAKFWNPCNKMEMQMITGHTVHGTILKTGKGNIDKLAFGNPCSQKIIFLKQMPIQTTFPCYLLTYDANGKLKSINYFMNIDF